MDEANGHGRPSYGRPRHGGRARWRAVLVVGVLAALAGCGASSGDAADDAAGNGDVAGGSALEATLRLDDALPPGELTHAVWDTDAQTLSVATMPWSSSCPPTAAPQERGAVLLIDVARPQTDEDCTADALTYVIEVTGAASRPDLVVLRSRERMRTVPVSGPEPTEPGPGEAAAAEVTADLPAYLRNHVARGQGDDKRVAVWLAGENLLVVPRSIPGDACVPAATAKVTSSGAVEVTSDVDLARDPDKACSEIGVSYTVTVAGLGEPPTEVSVDNAPYPVVAD